MDARLLHPTLSPKHSCLTIPHLLRTASAGRRLRLRATGPASSRDSESPDGGGILNKGTSASADANSAAPSVSPAQPTPPSTLNIKYRPRSRRRQESQGAARKPPPPKKEWEAMTLGEKAMELYVGEKGLLFWLNKFAYASIFIIAGGWILFRFVGPSLGLYQLDSSPLPPSAIFKGSS